MFFYRFILVINFFEDVQNDNPSLVPTSIMAGKIPTHSI
jgi:hypothetical protein